IATPARRIVNALVERAGGTCRMEDDVADAIRLTWSRGGNRNYRRTAGHVRLGRQLGHVAETVEVVASVRKPDGVRQVGSAATSRSYLNITNTRNRLQATLYRCRSSVV